MKTETSNSILEYLDRIVYVRVKSEIELSIESMKEQYEAQYKLVGTDKYVVLVDGRESPSVPIETRQFMARHRPANRLATAIVSNDNLATLITANIYLKLNRPNAPTRIFKDERSAVKWLKYHLYRSAN